MKTILNCGVLASCLVLAGACGNGSEPSDQRGQLESDLIKKGCYKDADCWAGTVCETCTAGPGMCVPGCQSDAECGKGAFCEEVICVTCPCPPRCTVLPPKETACANGLDDDRDGLIDCKDPDCAGSGSCACSPSLSTANPSPCCYPTCKADEVLECLGKNICGYPCSCVPAPKPACVNDSDCGAGKVCENCGSSKMDAQCVVGCHDKSQCKATQTCLQVQCVMCPCPGMCQ